MDGNVKAVLTELCKIENRDLLKAVMEVGVGTEIESFMCGFTFDNPLSFDDFVHIQNLIHFQLIPQLGLETDDLYLVNMSQKYDEYLKDIETRNALVALNQNETNRFEQIINKIEGDQGWSGAYYGWLMRNVQFEASKLNSN